MAGLWMTFISLLAHSAVVIAANDVDQSVRRILLMLDSNPEALRLVMRFRNAPYSSCRQSANGLRSRKLITAGMEMNSLGPMWLSAPADVMSCVVESKRCCLPLRSEEHTSELQSLRHLVCRL